MTRILATTSSIVIMLCSWMEAEPLRVAAWNLEHLNADGSEGCIDRTEADFTLMKQSILEQEFDVVAFQEVKDLAAAEKVFSPTEWNIEVSKRPHQEPNMECLDALGRFRQHIATGFAIRKGIDYERHDDVKSLGLGHNFHRWGTDISIKSGSNLRLLNVHLVPGCWSNTEDEDEAKKAQCADLRTQLEILVEWRDARLDGNESFAILGDFNRRLALPKDWGWTLLNTKDQKLELLTSAGGSKCHPSFSEFIDHIIVGDLNGSLLVKNSFREGPRIADHPDHCAVSADFELQ
ncbi:MAG: endonuclease [Gammaproteobacteria bacterium]|nr:endonuclease [Gammaproteobacteria bacterium]